MSTSFCRLLPFLLLPVLTCVPAKSGGFKDEDIVPADFDDLSDAKTIQILAGHGSRAAPFVSRGRAYLDKFQRILTDQEVPRRIESQIMRDEDWTGISSMARLRRLHIVRMNSRNRFLRFGKALCLFLRRTAPTLKSKMMALNEKQRAFIVSRLISFLGSQTSGGTKRDNSRQRRQRSSGRHRREVASSTFMTATRKLEEVHSSLHDFIIYKCDLEDEFLKLLEGFIKIIYFGDYHKLLGEIEKYIASKNLV